MTEQVKETCGRCNREKVEGKCPACGRPTKYLGDEEMIAKVDEYLATCVDEPYTLTKTDGMKSTTVENKLRVNLPMLEGFSLMLGIDDDTLVEWRKKYKKFSVAVERISKEQKKRLINMGLSGDYNAMIAKLNLSANHGMAEKSETDITSKGEKLDGIAVSFVDTEEEE